MFVSSGTQSIAQLKYGPKIGINFADQRMVYDGTKDNNIKTRLSFAIGGMADYAFSDVLSLQPSLLFSGKGSVYKSGDYKLYSKLYYLEMPINIAYKYDIGILQIYGIAGPYFGFAIGGTYKDDDESEKMKFGDGDDDDQIKRGDFGLNLGAGVEINSFQIGINYGLGLLNTSYVDKGKVHNRVFSVSACYFFGKGY